MVGPTSYIGGKNRLAKRIIEIFPKHATYVEPFAGGAQVFFHKEPSVVEILSDRDGEIINFFPDLPEPLRGASAVFQVRARKPLVVRSP